MADTQDLAKKKKRTIGDKTLTSKFPDDIKEKPYLTRQVDTSIALLEGPENDLILEALQFLSKYADLCLENLNYLQQKCLLEKLLHLFDKNICILRLTLRLLNILLSVEDVIYEFDQGIYDNHISKVTEFYIYHNDPYVKEFAVSILIKLANSCRITSLIFSVDLLDLILATLTTLKNVNLLQRTMGLLDVLLTAPAAISVLPEMKNFDASVIISFIKHTDPEVTALAFKVLAKLTLFGLDCYQITFREKKLVEKMIETVMDPLRKENHETALQVILNCMNSEITSSYFVSSLQFLHLCCWVKSCEPRYLRKCVDIFHKISSIPSKRQILFDLSAEESILYFLRSKDKYILNKTCEAISNMSEHRHCCEHMLTGTVVETIFKILQRTDDEEDPQHDVAIKTLCKLTRRSLKTLEILDQLNAESTFVGLFSKGLSALSQESYEYVTEIIYHFVVHPTYYHAVVNDKFFGELLKVASSKNDNVAIISTEIMTFCVADSYYISVFLQLNGPEIIIERLKRTKNLKLLKSLFILIHCLLVDNTMKMAFVKNGVVNAMKSFPESVTSKAPIIETILNLVFHVYLPFKFFETNRLSVVEKLNNQFYLITGNWTAEFPFLDILRYLNCTPIYTIYVVDYKYEVKEPKYKSFSKTSRVIPTEDKSKSSKVSDGSINSNDQMSTVNLTQAAHEINYGDLSPDPYLPKYIYHIQKLFENEESSIRDKIKILATYIDTIFCGPDENATLQEKGEKFQMHVDTLKKKLGTNMIPIGYLRIGFHCERALLFKAIADRTCIPCSLIQGEHHIYWNEVALLEQNNGEGSEILIFYVIDLMDNVGELLKFGSTEAEEYCNRKSSYKENNKP